MHQKHEAGTQDILSMSAQHQFISSLKEYMMSLRAGVKAICLSFLNSLYLLSGSFSEFSLSVCLQPSWYMVTPAFEADLKLNKSTLVNINLRIHIKDQTVLVVQIFYGTEAQRPKGGKSCDIIIPVFCSMNCFIIEMQLEMSAGMQLTIRH